MKRLIPFVLALLLAVSAFGQEEIQSAKLSIVVIGGTVSAGAGTCTWAIKDNDMTPAGESINGPAGVSTSMYGFQASFTAGATYTAKRLSVRLKKVGNPVGNLTISICTNNTVPAPDFPDVCTAIGTKDVSTFTDVYATYTFDYLAGFSITSGDIYWIRIVSDTLDLSDYVHMEFDGHFTMTNVSCILTNALVCASAPDESSKALFELYECE